MSTDQQIDMDQQVNMNQLIRTCIQRGEQDKKLRSLIRECMSAKVGQVVDSCSNWVTMGVYFSVFNKHHPDFLRWYMDTLHTLSQMERDNKPNIAYLKLRLECAKTSANWLDVYAAVTDIDKHCSQ